MIFRDGYIAELDAETEHLAYIYAVNGSVSSQALLNHLRRVQSALHTVYEDTKRVDWLSDPAQSIGNVTLPHDCVRHHLDSLRAAIDEAMTL